MNRIMVNIAKVDTRELARRTGLPNEAIDKVVREIIANKNNHKREPRPPVPEGGISLSEAERKYKMPNPTISRWVKRGYIPILLRTNRELYIDEAKLVEVIRRYKQNPGQGKKTIS